jgi:hypothetical protein
MNFITHCPFVIPYENIIFVSQKPTKSHWKDNLLHNETGKSVEFSDGWGVYSLNGVSVPDWLVTKKDTEISPKEILKLDNAQQRAEGIRKIGIERLWHKTAKIIDTDGGYELGWLPISESEEGLYLKMQNPSVPELWHVEGVDNKCKTVQDALLWRINGNTRNYQFDKNGIDWYIHGDVIIVPENEFKLKHKPLKIA